MTFPLTPLGVLVELYYDATWNDITSYVLVRDGIEISRGLSPGDTASVADPQTCTLTLNNQAGRFTPSNPRSPLYGKIGRNTQLRVSVVHSATTYVRFVGEVSEWPVRWDVSGKDVWTSVTASGVLRRIGQRKSVGRSPLRATLGTSTTLGRDSYWPMEDGKKGRLPGGTWGSAISGGKGLTIQSGKTGDLVDGWDGSDPLPEMNTAIAYGRCRYQGAGTAWTVWVNAFIPAAGAPAEGKLVEFTCSGTARTWQLWIGGTGLNDLRLVVVSAGGSTLLDTGYAFAWELSGYFRLQIEAVQDGTDIDYAIASLEQGRFTGYVAAGTLGGRTCGKPAAVEIGNGNLGGVAMGHVFVASQLNSLFSANSQLAGYAYELTSTRAERLAGEAGTSAATFGTALQRMGVQRRARAVDLMADVADVDGLIHDHRTLLALAYRTRLDRANPTVAALSYDDLKPPFDPVADDRHVVNDVTVTRTDGASARVDITSGPLSTLEPPNGVGLYDESVELNLYSDDQVEDAAAWRAAVGTYDSVRVPSLTIDLASNASLIATVAGLDIYDALEVSGLPTWMPPGILRQSIIGHTETLEQFGWTITFACVPQAPYDVVILDDTPSIEADRLSPSASTLAASYDDNDTSLSVASSVDTWITTATHASSFPFDIEINGERMSVTAITGTSSPWTFTVTRGLDGYAAAHAVGSTVRLARPRRLS